MKRLVMIQPKCVLLCAAPFYFSINPRIMPLDDDWVELTSAFAKKEGGKEEGEGKNMLC